MLSQSTNEQSYASPIARVSFPSHRVDFKGGSKYLDELMAQIDMPRLEHVRIEYSELDVAGSPIFRVHQAFQFKLARVDFGYPSIKLDRPQGECHQAHHSLIILDSEVQEFTAPEMAHLLDQLVPMLSNVVHLSVVGKHGRGDDMLPLLRLFPAVEAMDVSRKTGGYTKAYIASALEDIAEDMVTEVLPALQLLLLDDDDNKLERFLSLRRLSGRPVTIVNTQDEFVERLNSYQRR
ncbi:hypothetical protein EDB84DRAFT_1565473 [Lactarius hengduanensis]|nr:hypothetical protein EDB84DRAFT_1565473 [Lactarius hengduanensis]